MNRSVPTTNNGQPTTMPETMDAMSARIAFLERELVAARLAVACAKSSEDCMRLELNRMGRALAKATGNTSNSITNTCLEPQQEQDENSLFASLLGDCAPVAVPTSNPKFALRRIGSKQSVHRRARRTSIKKAMNPGSCSSAMNLLALAERLSSTDSFAGLAQSSSANNDALQRPRRSRLNPSSCASGLNLLDSLSNGSAANLLSRPSAASLLSRRPSVAVPPLGEGASANDAMAFLLGLGNARILSSSSFHNNNGGPRRTTSRPSNSRNAMRSADQGAGGGNRNAEWGVFR